MLQSFVWLCSKIIYLPLSTCSFSGVSYVVDGGLEYVVKGCSHHIPFELKFCDPQVFVCYVRNSEYYHAPNDPALRI